MQAAEAEVSALKKAAEALWSGGEPAAALVEKVGVVGQEEVETTSKGKERTARDEGKEMDQEDEEAKLRALAAELAATGGRAELQRGRSELNGLRDHLEGLLLADWEAIEALDIPGARTVCRDPAVAIR